MDANEMMWTTAAEDVAAERNLRVYSLAKVAAQQAVWAFLSAAATPAEYEARYELVADRLAEAVGTISPEDTALLDQVKTSLHEDWNLLVQSRRLDRMKTLAIAWADEDGPLYLLAHTGFSNAETGEEIEALGAMASAEDREELAELHRLALGREPNFSRQAEIDPSDIPPGREFDQQAFDVGREDGYYGDNAGAEQYGSHPDYQRGLEYGGEDAQDDKAHPELFHDGAKTGVSHPPYYITESGGKFKVVDDIGGVRGTFDSKDAAREQQKALYASVPGAAEKAEDKHGEPRPKSVQEQGKKPASTTASKTADRQMGPWMTWSGPALYDVHGNKLGGISPAEPHNFEGPYHTIMYRDRGENQAQANDQARWQPLNMGTYPDKNSAMRRVEEMFGTHHALRTAKDYSAEERRKAAESGHALSDGSFPIYDAQDVQNAKHRIGTTDHPRSEVVSHINRWAKEYGEPPVGEEKSALLAACVLQKDGTFTPVAVNEDAFGSERYEHVTAPATPSWIHDEFFDHNQTPLGDTTVKNNADGNELKPTAPWLVAEESLKTNPVSLVNATTTSGGSLTWTVPSTWTITADNPFFNAGPGNPGTMPAPDDDPSQLGLNPDATDPSMSAGYNDPSAGAGLPNPSLDDTASADGTDLMPMPSPSDDMSQANSPTATGARYTAPVEDPIDKIAAEVRAANRGLTLRQCVAIAKKTVKVHPELASA